VDRLAIYIAKTEPGLRGFSRANLFRMKQCYESSESSKRSARDLPRASASRYSVAGLLSSKIGRYVRGPKKQDRVIFDIDAERIREWRRLRKLLFRWLKLL
jgi:hypothetical protein